MYGSVSRGEDSEENVFLKLESAVPLPLTDFLGAKVKPCVESVTGIIRYDDPNIAMLASLSKKFELVQPLAEIDGSSFIYRMHLNYGSSAAQDTLAGDATFWLSSENIDAKRQMQEGIKKGVRYFISSPFRELRRGRAFLPITVKECWWGPETTEGTAYGLQMKP